MKGLKKRVGAGLLAFVLVFTYALILVPSKTVKATGSAILVKSGTISMEGANTSRNLAVGKDGTIHVVYKENGGIYYTKSTNSGATFSNPVKVVDNGREAEVAVSSNGRVFVSYCIGSNGYIAYSDNGTSFKPVELGAVGGGQAQSVHMATDGDHVYAVNCGGNTFWYSEDSGEHFNKHENWSARAYSDVLVDASTHNVIVIKDKPQLFIRYSTDYGKKFSEEVPVPDQQNQVSVMFSTAACGNGKVYIAGANREMYLIDYKSAKCETSYVVGFASSNPENPEQENPENTEIDSTSRSLSADNSGHVIAGYAKDGKVYYQYSTDKGVSFSNPIEVGTANGANAAINPKTGDVLFLFTDSEGLKLYNVVGGVTGGSSGESAQPATPEVSGRDGAVDAETLKEEYADKTPATDSAANDAGLNATQVVDLLAGNDTAAKEELVEKAVAKGHLTLNIKTDKSKEIKAKVDVPATLLSALTATEMMDGLLGLDNITIDLEVKVTNATDVPKAVSNAVEAKKATGEELFFFDADMFLTKNGTDKQALTEFGSNKIDITVDIPEAIRGANRVFRLIRTHTDTATGNLEVDVLEDQDKEANTFTLSTNKLCTLAFAYKSADLKSPKTGADALPFAVILISFAAVAFVVGAKKYQE
jgi:hypothetical protein